MCHVAQQNVLRNIAFKHMSLKGVPGEARDDQSLVVDLQQSTDSASDILNRIKSGASVTSAQADVLHSIETS